MKKRVIATLLLAATHSINAHALVNNVLITGNLVEEPCSLSPTSADIPLDYGTVVSKFFQSTNRTPGIRFSIELIDCDISLGSGATVTFTGPESALPGLLASDGGVESGLAFGIETVPDAEGRTTSQLIPINQSSPLFTLSDGQSVITLQGFIQAEPDAITHNTVRPGPFSATATFKVDYP